MGQRLRISNEHLPGFTYAVSWRRHPDPGFLPLAGRSGPDREDERRMVYDPDGDQVGEVIYVARHAQVGTEYGWRPALPGNWALSTQVEAVQKLIEAVVRS